MTRKGRRLLLIGLGLGTLSASAGLILVAIGDAVAFYKSPAHVASGAVRPGERVRLGGCVKIGSVARDPGAQTRFDVVDHTASVPVRYVGLLPDLFREGQVVVAEGMIGPDGVLKADTVLARHDENYTPKEAAAALMSQGCPQGAQAERR